VDKDKNTRIPLEHLSPQDARRTLGVTIGPDGSATQQLHIIIQRAREIQGKLQNFSLSWKNRWIALTSIIKPSLSYPLVATYFTPKLIQPYESNIHFTM
jgi:hypothetical protein